ncbi:MAG: ABC transporter ATP-binding protein [Anaerolineales bacterium]|nr:ABC transporter ATP-binding protein [Anaerolineales bacterium]
MLELRSLSKSYAGKPLLRDVSFSVNAGETVCLLGASGSGKSTLLRMIAGLDFPERGRILFNKLDLAEIPPHLRDFGLVFQDYGLFPHLNVFDNVAFGLKMRNLPVEEIKPRVAALLKQMNLRGFDSRRVTDLSGGEQQRVALARALAPNPRLLMFDEPLGALDRSLKEDLLNQIRGILRRAKIPAIYVTHDQKEAFAVADRILILHDGVIVRDAAPQEIWRNPRSAFAAKLLGIGNVIEGEIVAENRVKTEFGIFSLGCPKKIGEKIQLLITECAEGEDAEEIQLTVEDVVFKRDQFQIQGSGGLTFLMNEAPQVGKVVAVKIKVQCLS